MPSFEQQLPPPGALVIQGYLAGGGFRIGGEAYAGGVLIEGATVTRWAPATPDSFVEADFAGLFDLDPPVELLIVGTGPTLRQPPASLAAALYKRGVATEFMDSRAAARTFNVLVTEGRRVAAALLPF